MTLSIGESKRVNDKLYNDRVRIRLRGIWLVVYTHLFESLECGSHGGIAFGGGEDIYSTAPATFVAALANTSKNI